MGPRALRVLLWLVASSSLASPLRRIGGSSSDPAQFDFTLYPGAPGRLSSDLARHPPPSSAAAWITVVTPTRDPEPRFLRATTSALLGQTFQRFAWIIVDDHSTDERSLAALSSLRRNGTDSRVTVLRCEPAPGLAACHPSRARNAGLRLVRTPFVFFLDDDDLLEPTCLEKLARRLTNRRT